MSVEIAVADLLDQLGVALRDDGDLPACTPIDGSEIGRVASATPGQVAAAIEAAQTAFAQWRSVPAPRRGELVRLLG